MFLKNNEKKLVLCDCDINGGEPVFLDIGNHQPVALFGGNYHSAAIGSEGEVIFINRNSIKNSPNSPIEAGFLPEDEKASSLACCDYSFIVLSSKGRVFKSPIESNGVLNFSPVSELSGHEIICVSGTRNYFLAVSKEGRVFGCGSNEFGKLGLGNETKLVSFFTEISSFGGLEIRAAYAGFSHSLFETRDGKILSCGYNINGQLLRSGPGECVYSPSETTINEGAAFCIAGNGISVVLIGSSPPPNSPNMRINE